MNEFNVISTVSFNDFTAEVEKGQTVRLCPGEKYAPERVGSGNNAFSVPAKRLTLDVQGFNREDELVWLSWSITVHWGNDGPITPGDQDRYDGMFELRRIVQDALEAAGYRVRMGRYALPNDCVPLNGHFDCAEWYRDEQDHLRVRPVDLPVSKPQVPESTFRFDLEDGSSTNSGDAPSVPVEVRVDRNSILIRIPATPDDIYSTAEVYLEHYAGQIVVRVWNQETMRVDYGGDPVAAVTLLADSADRGLTTPEEDEGLTLGSLGIQVTEPEKAQGGQDV
ncbi:MAG: hypothetical protein V3S14_17715 [Anaerolineae bacterium]